MKLETKLRSLINATSPLENETYDVIAHELWGNMKEGYMTNDSWHIARDADLSTALKAARGRWEVFKLNYHPKARVSDINDIGYDDDISLEVDCIPFIEIRAARN